MAINVQGSADYQAVLEKINLWYGSDAQKIINIANEYELTPQQLVSDYLTGSGYEPWYTTSGAVGGYNSVGTSSINPSTAFAEAANSNTGATTITALKTPIETTVNQSGKVVSSSGLTSVATGAKSALTFITKDVLPAVNAAGLGIALGKTIDSALYNLNPDFWDNNGMSTLNPETWNSITKDYPDGFLKKAFNTVFGLNPNTGETQQYLDADAAAYLAMYMQSKGLFDRPEKSGTNSHYGQSEQGQYFNYFGYTQPITLGAGWSFNAQYISGRITVTTTATYGAAFIGTNNQLVIVFVSQSPFTVTQTAGENTTTYNAYQYLAGGSGNHTGTNYYGFSLGAFYSPTEIMGAVNSYSGNYPTNARYNTSDIYNFTFGGTVSGGSTVDGITDQDGATTPDFSNCQTPADYLSALQTQFPDLFNNAVTQSVVNPDGTTNTRTYVPIGTPSENNNGNKTQPVTNTNNSGNTQGGSSANPSTVDLTGLENLIKTLTETISQTGTPTDITNPDPTGTGNTPPVVAPTGQASSLFAVYNPSQAQLNSLGAWLWSSNFIDQVLKLFNNPMQAIIGLHKIFASPSISGSGNIKVGYLDSGVSSNIVGAQYTTINCGSVKVSEQFGNVFDYTDTQIRLYLPFIGIVDLDVADVMRGTVSVVYHVDVITGACLAEVKITRDGSGGTLYQYAGDAAVRYPISSGSYMGVVSGVLSAVGGIASAVMTGGATLPIAAGAVAGGLSGAHTQIQHSGNFAGNAGAMGAKKPYIIIERPQTAVAEDYKKYVGNGANVIKTVSEMSGYFRMSDVKLSSVSGASESELNEIKTALEGGVIK